MEEASAKLLGAKESEEGLYEAEVEISYKGHSYRLRLPKLLRRPAKLTHRLSGEYLVIELFDEEGGPLATCCIHKDHVEKGCMKCPSLLLPPESRESQS